MVGHAYRYEEDDDRKLNDGHAPAGGEPAGAGGDAGQAQHSLAEIGAQYDGPAGGGAAAAAAPDVDPLSMHGAAPEPTHVDPAATAVAQAELETGAAAHAPKEEHAAEAEDASGPEAGSVTVAAAPNGGGGGEGHHDVPSPGPVLAGAAQG